MKYFQFLIFFLLFSAFTTQTWEEFKSFEGRFSVETPAKLTEKADTIQTEIGKLVNHTFFHQADPKTAENLFYMVSYVDYPEGAMHSDSTEVLNEFFDTTIETAVESVKGNLIYSGESTYRDFPGRVWRIEYLEDKVVIKTKAYMVENRYYSIQTISFKELSLNPSADKFFDSFEIIGKGF